MGGEARERTPVQGGYLMSTRASFFTYLVLRYRGLVALPLVGDSLSNNRAITGTSKYRSTAVGTTSGTYGTMVPWYLARYHGTSSFLQQKVLPCYYPRFNKLVELY